MNLHVFVDESQRGSLYLLAATLICTRDLGSTRSLMRGLRARGERRVHFKHERDVVQKDIAAKLVARAFRTRIYQGTGKPEAVRCLRAAVGDIAPEGVARLVLESRDHHGNQSDRLIIRSALAACGAAPDLAYEHMYSYEEPALWIPDAIAWCYGAGGEWRRRIVPIVEKTVNLGAIKRRRR